MSSARARSLYVHVPFCAHRCGYCDFVTTSAQPELHARYVAALIREFELRQEELQQAGSDHLDGRPWFDTVFIGGGTPTLLALPQLERLLSWCSGLAAPGAEITIECNPETVSTELATTLVGSGATRVSLGAQSFNNAVLDTLERRADPTTVRRAVDTLRSAGLAQLSIDVIWGVPGQTLADVDVDIAALVELDPDHVSAYELEFKPGTRLARRFGSVDNAVGEASDEFYDRVVDGLEAAGYWWYETANFARGADRRCRHNLAYWTACDYMGIGVGAVGTLGGQRRTNLPNVVRWLASLEASQPPPARIETIDAPTRRIERLMLALRLDGPVAIPAVDMRDGIVDREGLDRIDRAGLGQVVWLPDGSATVRLDRRGRMLLNSVMTSILG